MRIKVAALVTALSIMLTGCGSVEEEPVGVTAPSAGVTSESSEEDAKTPVLTQAPETEATSVTTQETTETSDKKKKFTVMTEPPPEITDEGTIIYDRPNPEIEVSAEVFAEYVKDMGYSFCVPEGAKKMTYIIDTGYPSAKMVFYLNGVEWTAGVGKVDKKYYAPHPYVADYMTEIDCDLESGQVTNVHGVEGDIRYYEISFSDGVADSYKLWTEWYLQEDGLAVSLTGFSDDPIHTIPVETLA